MRATVGVVVTGFDQGDLVREAVASVLRQTRAPDQVVVVDDGSTDARSVAVLDAFRAESVVQVLRQENAGVSAARNAGLSRLTTELAVVLDGDDRLAETFVERTAALLDEDADVVGASSWLRMHGSPTRSRARPGSGGRLPPPQRVAATVMLRRARWRAAGGYATYGDGGMAAVVRIATSRAAGAGAPTARTAGPVLQP
ncbi:glycosyltransferase family A protein [Oerskovia sp. M15]